MGPLGRSLPDVEKIGAISGRCFRQRFSQCSVGAADFRSLLQHDWGSVIDGRRDYLIGVGDLPQNLAIRDLLDVFLGESGNLFIAVQNNPQTIAPCPFFQEAVDTASTP